MPTPSQRTARLVAALLLLFVLLVPAVGRGHDMAAGLLSIEEVSPGRFQWHAKAPQRRDGAEHPVTPRFPDHCMPSGRDMVECGPRGLDGEVRLEGVEGRRLRILVHVRWLDGQMANRVLAGGEDRFQLDAGSQGGSVAGRYGRLGVEHILGGIDHLAFVAALLLLVGIDRRLVATVTSFTLAHSITLALAVLGLARLPASAVEASIALSILLVAAEGLDGRPTLTRTYPWAVAFTFGLLHGFGFAGALADVGLPPDQVPLALLCFNVGVELGQLAFVGVVALVWIVGLRRLPDPWPDRLRRATLYMVGCAAAYWTLERAYIVLAA